MSHIKRRRRCHAAGMAAARVDLSSIADYLMAAPHQSLLTICGWTAQELMRRIIRKEQLAVRYAGPFGGASQAWDGSDVVVLLAGGIAVSILPIWLCSYDHCKQQLPAAWHGAMHAEAPCSTMLHQAKHCKSRERCCLCSK